MAFTGVFVFFMSKKLAKWHGMLYDGNDGIDGRGIYDILGTICTHCGRATGGDCGASDTDAPAPKTK